jgi:hypothetical protein
VAGGRGPPSAAARKFFPQPIRELAAKGVGARRFTHNFDNTIQAFGIKEHGVGVCAFADGRQSGGMFLRCAFRALREPDEPIQGVPGGLVGRATARVQGLDRTRTSVNVQHAETPQGFTSFRPPRIDNGGRDVSIEKHDRAGPGGTSNSGNGDLFVSRGMPLGGTKACGPELPAMDIASAATQCRPTAKVNVAYPLA